MLLPFGRRKRSRKLAGVGGSLGVRGGQMEKSLHEEGELLKFTRMETREKEKGRKLKTIRSEVISALRVVILT